MLQVTSLPFSLAGPGQTTSGGVEVTPPGSASFTAAISTDSHSIFKVVKLTLLRPTPAEPDDPGSGDGVKLHLHKPVGDVPIVFLPVGSSDGITPLKASANDKVQVTVQMTVPNDPDDTYSAILTITSSNADFTTTAPLSVPTGQVDVQVLNNPVTAGPGAVATWSVRVTSLAGAGRTISFVPDIDPSTSLSSSPVTVFLPRRGLLTLAITATVGALTPPGSYQISFFSGIFNTFSLALSVPDTHLLRPSPIDSKYASLGGPSSFLGAPVAPEAFCSDLRGQFRPYLNGVIYWSGVDGSMAFEVHSPTLTVSGSGQEGAFPSTSGLGYPTSDVTTVLVPPIPTGQIGKISHFQKGAIYWTPNTGVHELVGSIFDKYVALGEEDGVLGFPIDGLVGVAGGGIFGDFENGALFSRAFGEPALQLIAFVGSAGNVKPGSVVLSQVNQVIDAAVQKYNLTADHKVAMEGGPVFQNPPVTGYTSIGNSTQNRQYRILQNFFVSGGLCPDITIVLTFDLLLELGGPTAGGTDFEGKPTGPTNQSISVRVTNAAASVDTHGNRFASADKLQQAHDRIVALATQTRVDVPLSGGPFLSLKILTSGTGVGLSDEHFLSLGVGAIALLLEP